MNIKIIENFLNQEDYSELTSLNIENLKDDQLKIYHNRINNKNEVYINECIKEETIKRLVKNYHDQVINLLRELSPEKIALYEYSEFHIVITGANYKFPIHDDVPNKLLSGVIYLKPTNNRGTIFYKNKNGDERKEIEWKKNRAVFFTRKERKTWHSYEGDGKSNRVALVYNLMTENIKKVCEIEKINYAMCNFRNTINPFLYKYFKFIL